MKPLNISSKIYREKRTAAIWYKRHVAAYIETDGYPNGANYNVSLNVENKDSMTHFSIGDKVVVYYIGSIAESDPLQINTVYAITLKTPADRTEKDKS